MVDYALQIMQNVIMLMPPIEITEQKIVIPQRYKDTEFSVELVGENFVFRPKTNGKNGHTNGTLKETSNDADLLNDEEMAELKKKHPWIGSVKGLAPDLSERVEEILRADIDPRSGWTTKEPLTD